MRGLNCCWFENLANDRKFINVLFFALITVLSVPVVGKLLSEKQKMNASFDPLRLVTSYGAFGPVAEEREEWIISASTARRIGKNTSSKSNLGAWIDHHDSSHLTTTDLTGKCGWQQTYIQMQARGHTNF